MFSCFHEPKFIFFGTPKFAAIALKKMIREGLVPEAIVCNPDEPTGRKKILTAPAVKNVITNSEKAIKEKVKILQPINLTTPDIVKELKQFEADYFVVAAYNKIIPEEILNIPKFKTIGIHPSILPEYRGPSPIQTAIIDGKKETGTTLFITDKEIDHGLILISKKCKIDEKDNYETLTEKLALIGAKLLINNILKYITSEIDLKEQNHSRATFTKKFSTEDGKIDLEHDFPKLIQNKIKALNPSPGVFTMFNTQNGSKRLKLLDAEIKDGKINLLKVQLEGKKPMDYKDFLNGIKYNSNNSN